MELIWNNVRWPREVRMDNYAMIAATKSAEERMIELLDKYGRERSRVRREDDGRTEKAVREDIRAMPDGVYRGEAATDDDGTVLESLSGFARAHVADDEMTSICRGRTRSGPVSSTASMRDLWQGDRAAILTFDPALGELP